jgi:hypothetical protein
MHFNSLFEDLGAKIGEGDSQGNVSRFFNSKDSAVALDRYYKTLDAILQDANVTIFL